MKTVLPGQVTDASDVVAVVASTLGDVMKAFGMLTAVVLLVVGIGVGIVAATEGQSSYGPSGAQFTADFPARPQSAVLCPNERMRKCYPGITHILSYYTKMRGVLLAEVEVWLGGPKALSAQFHGLYMTQSDGMHMDFLRLHQGARLTAVRVLKCASTPEIANIMHFQCLGLQLEFNRHAFWEVSEFAGNLTAAKAFLASFHPLN